MTVVELAPPLWDFHLPGKHDQKSHGRHGSGAATGGDALNAVPYHRGGEGSSDATDGALGFYVAAGYLGINGDLRAGRESREPWRTATENIDSAMKTSALTADIEVARGLKNPNKVFGSDWNDDDVTGLTFRDDGFVSTSASLTGRNFFTSSDGVSLRIVAPKGTHALVISEIGESEILLDRGLRYRVTRDNGVVDGLRRLDVEVT